MNIRPTDESMVQAVYEWWCGSGDPLQEQFKNCKESQLWEYHHSLGRSIRNHFELWKYERIPELENDVDVSDEHPDAISMRVIKLVWDKVQKPKMKYTLAFVNEIKKTENSCGYWEIGDSDIKNIFAKHGMADLYESKILTMKDNHPCPDQIFAALEQS